MDVKDDELIDLISRCALRDQAALKALFDRCSGYLNAVAFRILKSDDLANDALQEAFVQIWENASSYRPDIAKPLTWMTSITRYRSLDRLSKEQRHQNKLSSLGDDGELDMLDTIPGDEQEQPDVHVQQGQIGQQIHACLKSLSDRMGHAIRLAYLEGFTREEIAIQFNTNANTVKSWLHRGSDRLKKCLENSLEMTR